MVTYERVDCNNNNTQASKLANDIMFQHFGDVMSLVFTCLCISKALIIITIIIIIIIIIITITITITIIIIIIIIKLKTIGHRLKIQRSVKFG